MSDCLVLSFAYQPVTRVNWTKAITWVLSGRVEVLEEYEDRVIRSPNQVFPMPSVIRFVRKVAGFFRRGAKFNRKNIWTRDKGRCQFCGDHVSLAEFTFDHVIPRNQGGKTCWENIVVCCPGCNVAKRDRTPAQARMRLLSQPVRPKSLPGENMVFLGGMPDSWKSYLASVAYWDGALDSD